MLRTFIDVNSTPALTTHKSTMVAVTGMGVVVDDANRTVSFPTAQAGSGISLLDKERIPTGINTARGEMSDYDEDFVTIAVDEFVKLRNYVPSLGQFGTDQFVAGTYAAGDRVAVGTDGKWLRATVPSLFQFVQMYNDNGHSLMWIKTADALGSN
jgi:hypothetical protein